MAQNEQSAVDVKAVSEVARRLNNAGDATDMEMPPVPEWFDEQARQLRAAIGEDQ